MKSTFVNEPSLCPRLKDQVDLERRALVEAAAEDRIHGGWHKHPPIGYGSTPGAGVKLRPIKVPKDKVVQDTNPSIINHRTSPGPEVDYKNRSAGSCCGVTRGLAIQVRRRIQWAPTEATPPLPQHPSNTTTTNTRGCRRPPWPRSSAC